MQEYGECLFKSSLLIDDEVFFESNLCIPRGISYSKDENGQPIIPDGVQLEEVTVIDKSQNDRTDSNPLVEGLSAIGSIFYSLIKENAAVDIRLEKGGLLSSSDITPKNYSSGEEIVLGKLDNSHTNPVMTYKIMGLLGLASVAEVSYFVQGAHSCEYAMKNPVDKKLKYLKDVRIFVRNHHCNTGTLSVKVERGKDLKHNGRSPEVVFTVSSTYNGTFLGPRSFNNEIRISTAGKVSCTQVTVVERTFGRTDS